MSQCVVKVSGMKGRPATIVGGRELSSGEADVGVAGRSKSDGA